MTQPGYRAWLDDGKQGTFEKFILDQAEESNKEYIKEEILRELEEMSLEELRQILEAIRDGNFIN